MLATEISSTDLGERSQEQPEKEGSGFLYTVDGLPIKILPILEDIIPYTIKKVTCNS